MKLIKGISVLFIALAIVYTADFFIGFRILDWQLFLIGLLGLSGSIISFSFPKQVGIILLVSVLLIVGIVGVDLTIQQYKRSQADSILVEAEDNLLISAVDPNQYETAAAKWVKDNIIQYWGVSFSSWLVYDRISLDLLWEEEVAPEVPYYEAMFTFLSALVIGVVVQILLSRWLNILGVFIPIIAYILLWYYYIDIPGWIYGLYFFGLVFYSGMQLAAYFKRQAQDRTGQSLVDLKYYRVFRMSIALGLGSGVLVLVTSLIVALLPLDTINTGVDLLLPNLWGTRTDYDTQQFRLYSLGDTGYQDNTSRLGGPVGPLDRTTPLFWVTMETLPSHSLYLKGQIKNVYNGNSWVKTEQNYQNYYEHYLSVPQNRMVVEEGSGLEVSGVVEFDTLKTISIFAPIGFYSSDMDPSKVYVSKQNQAFYKGGIFIDFIDRYEFSATQKDFTLPTPEDYVVSDTVSPQVVNYIRVFQRFGDTPQERVALMVRFLRENYTYNLAVTSKRQHPDFVTDFLVESREGYCTYFASAMAIMARINDIPARYVEGFRVDPGEFDPTTKRAKVTEADAHAWVEVYFEGEGWRVVEATAPFTETALQPADASEAELAEAVAALEANEANQAIEGSEDGLDSSLVGDEDALNLENALYEDGRGFSGQSRDPGADLDTQADEIATAKAALEAARLKEFRTRIIVIILVIIAVLGALMWWLWPIIVRFKRVDLSKLSKLIYDYEDLLAKTQDRKLAPGAYIASAMDLSAYTEILPTHADLALWNKVIFAPQKTVSQQDIETVLQSLITSYAILLQQHYNQNGLIKHWIFRLLNRV